MDIGKDTGLGSFTPGELTTSSAIHGDFDQASLNYSGHQNLEVRGAEYFAAASTATPNLNREKTNLRSAIRDEIDPNFEYSQCVWGPYALRMEGATTNKFYMVFVYDNGNGVFRALGGYGGLAQNPRLFDVMTTRDQASAVAAATRKLKAKERKGYFTYRSEEGNAPIQDPMEFGEMANWTPMDGTPGLSKRKRAESTETYSGGSYGTILTFGEIAYEYDYDDAPMIFEEDSNFDTWLKSTIRDTGRGEGEDNFEYAFTVEDEEKNETYTMDHPIYVKWTHEYSDFNTAETGTYAAESNFNKLARKISMQYQDKGKSKEEADEIGRRTAYTIGAKKYGKRGMTRKAMAGRKSAEDIPVWNDGIVEWETSGPMSPTGSGYSSASAPPTGVIAGPGDTFLNYTEAQNYLVETSGGLYGAEHFEAMSRIDPKNAQDVKKVKDALKQRYKGIKINRVEYITNRRGSSNKYHVFAFTDRGVFNGYGRIGKTMTIFGPMSSAQGEKKMDTKMRRGGYKEQV
jgi:predicted DNA-binding WGR domain protein